MTHDSVTEKASSIYYRAILVAMLAQATSFFICSAALWMPPNGRFVQSFEPLSHNPWNNQIAAESQVRHRILGPVLAYYTGLRGYSSLMVPIIGGTLMLFLTYLAVYRFSNHLWATWTTFLIATTQTLISSQTWFGYQDALGGAAVAACLVLRQSWLAAICLFIGMLGDERCAASIPLILLWHFDNDQPGKWKRVVLWGIFLTASVVFWIFYYQQSRHLLLPADELSKSSVGIVSFNYIKQNINLLPISFFESIRGGWILIGYAMYLFIQQQKWLVALGCLVGITVCLLQAGMVSDVSRSASVVWPMILIAIREIYRQVPGQPLTLLKTAVFLNLLSPCYQVLAPTMSDSQTGIQLYYPLPVSIFRWLAGF